MKIGIIGDRDLVDPLIGGRISNPHANSINRWLYFIPRTGRAHGDSLTIATNLSLKWLRKHNHECSFVIYLVPKIGVGGDLYREVNTDSDFIEAHTDLNGFRLHSKYVEGVYDGYCKYLRYFIRNFPRVYFLPLREYLDGSNEYLRILKDFPNNSIDPRIFDRDISKVASNFLGSIRGSLSERDCRIVEMLEGEVLTTIERLLRERVTARHEKILISHLGLHYDPTVKSNLKLENNDVVICSQFTCNYFNIAVRLLISLRTIGGHCGRIVLLLYGDGWENWQITTLEKLGCNLHFILRFDLKGFMVQRFIDSGRILSQYPEKVVIHLDSDIWVQSRLSSVIEYLTVPSFGVWHGTDHLLVNRGLEKYVEKYLRILQKTTPKYLDAPGFPLSKGGFPHGGFHGGPKDLICSYYDNISKLISEKVISYDYSQDEIGLFISCDVERDHFNLNDFWTSFPSKLNLVTREIEDENGEVKPVLHFEKKQKDSNIIDFMIIHPTVTVDCIERLKLFEMRDALSIRY